MVVLKYILLIAYIIVTFVLIVLALIQSKDGSGITETVTGSSSSNFYNQNKGKTKEGKMKKMTIISAVCFAVLAVVLSIFYF